MKERSAATVGLFFTEVSINDLLFQLANLL